MTVLPQLRTTRSLTPLGSLACVLTLVACGDNAAPAVTPPQPGFAGATGVVGAAGVAGITGATAAAGTVATNAWGSAGSAGSAGTVAVAGTAAQPIAAGSAALLPAAGAAGTATDTAGAGATAGAGGSALPVAGDYVWPADCEEHVKFLSHNQAGASDTSKKQVQAGVQYYASYYYKPTWGDKEIQGLKFRSIVDNKKIVHHWILYGVNSGASQQDGAVQGGEGQPIGAMPNEFYIAGWAPGSPDVEMPDNVGLHMPYGSGAMLRMEVHYFNNSPTAAVEEDASGVEFCYTSKKRAQEAAIHWMGSTSISLPAHTQKDVTSQCVPRVSNGPVHLMSLSAHMHKTGVHATATLNRANGEKVMLIDDPFSFMDQKAFKQPRTGTGADIEINQGDTIDVSCSYDNQTNAAISFGENTENEMCFFYAMAWPRGELQNGSAFSLVPGAEPEVNCIR